MKRKIILFLVFALYLNMLTIGVSAKVGDVNGKALHTDIVAYVNHYALPSYAVNGTSCIVAEDLRNFGFDVSWDGDSRSLTIIRNEQLDIVEQYVSKNEKTGSFFADTLETDIQVFAAERKLTSYAINGYTMIPIEELTMFGEVYWVAEERAIKLWVEDLNMRSSKQYVPYTYTEVVTSSVDDNTGYNGSHVYVTRYGKKYHYDRECAGKNATSISLAKAKAAYGPCRTCVN